MNSSCDCGADTTDNAYFLLKMPAFLAYSMTCMPSPISTIRRGVTPGYNHNAGLPATHEASHAFRSPRCPWILGRRGCLAGAVRACARAGLSDAAGQGRGPGRARRRQRHDRAACGAEAVGAFRAAVLL